MGDTMTKSGLTITEGAPILSEGAKAEQSLREKLAIAEQDIAKLTERLKSAKNSLQRIADEAKYAIGGAK